MQKKTTLTHLGIAATLCLSLQLSANADIEPCGAASPPPPTLRLTPVSNATQIGDPIDIAVSMSGLDPDGPAERFVRGAQFFLEYTGEECGTGDMVFTFIHIKPGAAGAADDSPYQEEIASGQDDPQPGVAPGLIRYAVGIPLGDQQSACDNILATIRFTPTREGVLTIWFRDPALLPATKLSDDDGHVTEAPELRLPQGDATNALTIAVDFTPPTIECPAAVTLPAEADAAPLAIGFPTVSDNCDAAPVLTYDDEIGAGGCDAAYTLKRTWRATDASGNQSECVQAIQVGPAEDCDANGIWDGCELDSDGDGVIDACDDPPAASDTPDDESPPAGDVAPTCCADGLCGIWPVAATPLLLLGLHGIRRRYSCLGRRRVVRRPSRPHEGCVRRVPDRR